MHRFFYGIGIFLSMTILSVSVYSTYEISILKAEIQQLKKVEKESLPADGQAQKTGYLLKEEQGIVVVYRRGENQVYEKTTIALASLPESIQKEIKEGKYLQSEVELYGFLENYSS